MEVAGYTVPAMVSYCHVFENGDDEEDTINVSHLFSTHWPLDMLLDWLDSSAQFSPAIGCFVNGKCVQAGLLTPQQITKLEESWK